jgi:hypothetical protein
MALSMIALAFEIWLAYVYNLIIIFHIYNEVGYRCKAFSAMILHY